MQMKKILCGMITCSMILGLLSGCADKEEETDTQVEGLENLGMIHVISREEGSGTRSVFTESIGLYDNATGQDFLTYVCGAGQEIVGRHFQTVKKSTAFLSNQADGTIRIGGSSSMAGLMEELAKAYMELNPNAEITVTVTDSTDGLTRAMSGELDFGMSSRELKDYEKELLEYVSIARDEIAVILNNENRLQKISSADLMKIYAGEISEWIELYTEDEEENKQ